MKKLLLTLTVIFISILPSFAQFTMYGMTALGGDSGAGVVFGITPNGTYTKITDLKFTYAAAPAGGLLLASDGNFYGMSGEGGYNNSCTMFKCTPNGTLSTVINMDTVWGSSGPSGSLIEATDGNIYGMTTFGGDSSNGVIFRYVIATGRYTAIFNFRGTTGCTPYGDLLQASDGNLYGMTSVGGAHDQGAIFKCTLTGTFTKLFDFDSASGFSPFGSLIQATDGYLYGMTMMGGLHDSGTIFKCSTTGAFTKIFDFTEASGGMPFASLIQGTDGYLYGLTYAGGADTSGTLFKCSTSGSFTKLLDFNGPNGLKPLGSLSQGTDGLLYGMTSYGGTGNYGIVFKCTTSGTLTPILNFNITNGQYPMYGHLIEGQNDLGINEMAAAKNEINIYPDPNNGTFQLAAGTAMPAGNNRMEIYNMSGEIVYSSTLCGNLSNLQVDMGSPAKGIYIYRVTSGTGSILGTGRFVVE